MPEIQSVTLEQTALALTQAISSKAAEKAQQQLKWGNPIRAYAHLAMDAAVIVAKFTTYIASQKCAEHKFKAPLDWREALKERFAPAWFLKRWPVRYRFETVKVVECYPELPLPKLGPTFKIMQVEKFQNGEDFESF